MSKINVLFFATLKDYAGERNTTMEIEPGASVADLKEKLRKRYPKLDSALGSALVAVNKQYAFDGDPIPEGAEVALFPPVSGG